MTFSSALQEDTNHRYKSWEHCYRYFSNNSSQDIDVDTASLHLSFYLASWGMYRGSSFLLQKDYKIHQDVVRKLLNSRHLQDKDFKNITEKEIGEIISLFNEVKKWYRDNISQVNGKTKHVNATDTLVSKIMLGTLCCTPAYDRYFIRGLRKSDIGYSSVNLKGMRLIIRFYQDHLEEFTQAQKKIKGIHGVYYPAMKLVDMYFWQIGYETDTSSS